MSKEVEEAAGRIERYVAMRDAKPLNNLDDLIHGIHTGTEWAAELRLSDLRAYLSLARREREMREALEDIKERSRSWNGVAWTYNRAGEIARAALSKDQP